MKATMTEVRTVWEDQLEMQKDGKLKKIGRKRVLKVSFIFDLEEFPDALQHDGCDTMTVYRPTDPQPEINASSQLMLNLAEKLKKVEESHQYFVDAFNELKEQMKEAEESIEEGTDQMTLEEEMDRGIIK